MNVLSKIWAFIKKWWFVILAIVLLIIFVPAFGTWLSNLWQGIQSGVATLWKSPNGIWKTLGLAFGLIAVVSPETASDIVENLGQVASTVVSVAGDVAGGALSTLFSNPWVLAAGAFAVWYFFLRDKGKRSEVVVANATGAIEDQSNKKVDSPSPEMSSVDAEFEVA